jgi:acetate kinase
VQEQVSSSIKSEVTAVGHRVVHGLDISQPVMLTPPVVDKIKAAAGKKSAEWN